MNDRLSLLSSRSMSCCTWMDGLEDGYSYDYHDYYYITLIMLLINLMMLAYICYSLYMKT
jgi:hypothetical protein